MLQQQFSEITEFIRQSRAKAIRAVNTELINLYWNVGAYIHRQLAGAAWGEKTVDELAAFIQKNEPELKGFNRRGLYRMKQFYETYSGLALVGQRPTIGEPLDNQDSQIVSSVRTQLGGVKQNCDLSQDIIIKTKAK